MRKSNIIKNKYNVGDKVYCISTETELMGQILTISESYIGFIYEPTGSVFGKYYKFEEAHQEYYLCEYFISIKEYRKLKILQLSKYE